MHERRGCAAEAVVARRHEQRDVAPAQRLGARVGEPAGGVDDVGLQAPEEPAQLSHGDGVGERRLMPATRLAARERQRAQLAEAVHGDAAVVAARRQVVLPDGRHRHLVTARVQFAREHLRLALGTTDERRIVVACEQDPHAVASRFCSAPTRW